MRNIKTDKTVQAIQLHRYTGTRGLSPHRLWSTPDCILRGQHRCSWLTSPSPAKKNIWSSVSMGNLSNSTHVHQIAFCFSSYQKQLVKQSRAGVGDALLPVSGKPFLGGFINMIYRVYKMLPDNCNSSCFLRGTEKGSIPSPSAYLGSICQKNQVP